jgi:hypothetical protein
VFDDVVEEALRAARCVVVLWSKASVASDWVKTEAAEAAQKRALVPVLIQDAEIPLQFRRLQAADLTAWSGASDAEFEKLCAAIAPLVGRSAPPAQLQRREIEPWRILRRRWPLVLTAVVGIVLLIAFLVSKMNGRVVVPSVIGQSVDHARKTLADSRLLLGAVSEEPAATVAPQSIVKQNPAPGATVKKGMSVAVVVSVPAKPVVPPSRPLDAASPAAGDPGPKMVRFGVVFTPFALKIHVLFITEEPSQQGVYVGAKGPGGFVMSVEPGPALKAGLRAGDVITAIAGASIRTEDDLRQAFKKMGAGVTRFTLMRGTEEVTLDVDCPGCV